MNRVAVVGAGMAGMACARMLQREGFRPLLIAPAHEVSNRGETLSFRARPYLETLGWLPLLDADTAIACEGRYSIWAGPALRHDDAHSTGGSGWHIDRRRLEARMAATLEADGVKRRVGEVRQLSRSAERVHVDLVDGSRLVTGFVVDCTGRASISSGSGSLTRLDKLVACYDIVTLDDDAEAATATFVEAVSAGWWYMAPLPGNCILIAFFTDSDLLPSGLRKDPGGWADMALQTLGVSKRLASLGIDLTSSHPQFAPASTVTSTRLVEPRIIRAGDAACALDPLAANGLATALWSGIQAAESAAGLLDHDGAAAARYEQMFLEGVASHLVTQRAMYASEFRFNDAPFWRRRKEAGPM